MNADLSANESDVYRLYNLFHCKINNLHHTAPLQQKLSSCSLLVLFRQLKMRLINKQNIVQSFHSHAL